jgi:hypothetical protein
VLHRNYLAHLAEAHGPAGRFDLGGGMLHRLLVVGERKRGVPIECVLLLARRNTISDSAGQTVLSILEAVEPGLADLVSQEEGTAHN